MPTRRPISSSRVLPTWGRLRSRRRLPTSGRIIAAMLDTPQLRTTPPMHASTRAACALLLPMALGCSPRGSAPPPPAAAVQARADDDPLRDLSPEVRQIAREVEQVRGLRFRRPFTFVAVTDDELEAHFDEGKLESTRDASDPGALWAFGFLDRPRHRRGSRASSRGADHAPRGSSASSSTRRGGSTCARAQPPIRASSPTSSRTRWRTITCRSRSTRRPTTASSRFGRSTRATRRSPLRSSSARARVGRRRRRCATRPRGTPRRATSPAPRTRRPHAQARQHRSP